MNPVVDEYTSLIQSKKEDLNGKKNYKKKKTKEEKILKEQREPIEKTYARFIKGREILYS